MAHYQYTAFSNTGQKVTGVIEALSPQAATQKLKTQNLYVREIREDSAKRDRELFPFLSAFLYRIKRKETGIFSRQLGTLLGAGIPLNEALSDISEQTENPHLRKIVQEMKQQVIEGKSLSEAIKQHANVFPPVYESMIRVGEATGNYEPTLKRLADLEERNEELKAKAITAMIYPGFMLVISVAVVFFLMTSVVPQLSDLFSGFKAELPLITRVVIGLSGFFSAFWYVMILAIFGGIYAFVRYRKTKEGKMKSDRMIMKIPFFGSLLRRIQVGLFCRNMGILIESQVPLLDALKIVSATVTNSIFVEELTIASQQIKEGSSLRESLKNSVILPQMARGMIAAGESTDRLAELMIKAAEIMESEVDSAVRRMTQSLEPIMIVFLGGIVAAIMAAVMLPMYKMTEYIK
ncbi:type II secretion system F family protein [Turneriella parva]|uniref:General secretion pathway protein F n=1 Tax=Turneriella parva (strain ATCC BAA-1111 / DSM 21527 / NCTC 11395 / H) TaxID=869212 RepID=I4BBU9_TURPD|nr:type II secretion system F family protein [Turneriella parva]AFM14756.1 type II secretion system protein F (GspF) [Turneriella parva DSM 21527]